MSKFGDALKHLPGASLVIEVDEEAPVAKPAPHVASAHPAFDPSLISAAAAAPAYAPTPGSPFSVPTAVVVDEKVYQNILCKTDFDKTSVGRAVHKYFD